jgi:hypothetical protein
MEQVEIAGRLLQSLLSKHEQVPVVLLNSMEVRIVVNREQLRKPRDVNGKRRP